MASTNTTSSTSAPESPVSRKRPAEDEPPKAAQGEEQSKTKEEEEVAPATTDAADSAEGEQQPAKRARTEEQDDAEAEKAAEDEDKDKDKEAKKDQKQESKLAFVPAAAASEGFSSFSSFAGPLSFSSVSSSTDSHAAPLPFSLGGSANGAAPAPFSIDFSSPTPFGSLFGGDGSKDSGATPSLSSTGFTLFSSSSPSTSSDFAFNLSTSSSSLLFSSGAESSSTSVAEKVEVVTGEENEERVHSVRAKLLKLEPESQAWKERGSGQLHLNVAKDRSYARLVMRAEGALRLILNAALFPHTITKRVQEKGVQVSAVEEGKPVLYLLRVSRRDEAEELFAAINRNKDLTAASEAQ